MIYGNKLFTLILILSLFFLSGCGTKNFYYKLYDGYEIKKIDDEIKLYQNDNLILIPDQDYKIKEFKYNSDVVCLKLSNNNYYMVYYFDSSVYGPYTKETLDETTNNLSMTFPNDFQNILKVDGLIYE